MLSPAKLGGGVPITSVTRLWLNSNFREDGTRPLSKSVVVWCHGAGHHARDSSVFRFGTEMSKRGHTVVVFDAEGNGCSSGLHGLCTSFDRWSLQAIEAVQFAQRRLKEEAGDPSMPDLPAFIMGESMGGALSVNTVLLKSDMWAGLILGAPMCAIAPELMPAWPVVQALRCFATCCPGWAVVPMQDHLPHCFRNGHDFILKRARSDPLRYTGVNRLGTGLQSLNVMDKVMGRAADISLPLLVLHGTADVVTDPDTSLHFWESTSSEDKTYIKIKDAWHVLWFDNYDNRVFTLDAMDEWISQRCVSSAPEDAGAPAPKAASLRDLLRPAARILEVSGSCFSELVGEAEVPVPPGGPEQCFWAVDPAAVEGDAPAAGPAAAEGEEAVGEGEAPSGAELPRLTLRLLEGPPLPHAWADAPMRRKAPAPDASADLIEGSSEGEGVEELDAVVAAEATGPSEDAASSA